MRPFGLLVLMLVFLLGAAALTAVTGCGINVLAGRHCDGSLR